MTRKYLPCIRMTKIKYIKSLKLILVMKIKKLHEENVKPMKINYSKTTMHQNKNTLPCTWGSITIGIVLVFRC